MMNKSNRKVAILENCSPDKRYARICPAGGSNDQLNIIKLIEEGQRPSCPPRSAHYRGLDCFGSQLGLAGLSRLGCKTEFLFKTAL